MIRELTVADLSGMSACGEEFHREAKNLGPFSREAFEASWKYFFEAGAGHIFGDYSDDGEFRGALGLLVAPDPNSGLLHAQEAFWFVRPQFRGKGLKLLIHAMDWVKASGIRRFTMVHLSSIAPATLKKLYLRMGFVELETHYQIFF